MNSLCCIARHVLMRFYAEGESTKKYAIDIAKKYGVDANELKAEIVNNLKGKKIRL